MSDKTSSIAQNTSATLRKLFYELPESLRRDALDTLREYLGVTREIKNNLPVMKQGEVHRDDDRLLKFYKQLEDSSESVRNLFLDTMIEHENLQRISQGPLSLYREPPNVDRKLLTAEMGQADRFRLSALILEIESPGVAFDTRQITNEILRQWLEQQGKSPGEETELPAHLEFSNLSKTSKDLETSGDIQCIERMHGASKFALTPKGFTNATEHAQTLQKHAAKPA